MHMTSPSPTEGAAPRTARASTPNVPARAPCVSLISDLPQSGVLDRGAKPTRPRGPAHAGFSGGRVGRRIGLAAGAAPARAGPGGVEVAAGLTPGRAAPGRPAPTRARQVDRARVGIDDPAVGL